MRMFMANGNVGLQLVTGFLLTYINTVSPHIPTESDFLNVPSGDACPNTDDVKPCRCTNNRPAFVSMECSDIESEEKLKEVFSKHFPIKDLYQLRIICHGSNTLKALKSGDLGDMSFEEIFITYCGMTTIEEAALEGSYATVDSLSLQENHLTSIPDLSKFKALKYLDLTNNSLDAFPIISSKTLVSVDLSGNKFSTIPKGAISKMPSLSEIYLYDLNLTHIPIGVFDGNDKLATLDLSNNSLSNLTHGVIKLHGLRTYLRLSHNLIEQIMPGSFTGVTKILDLQHNALTELPENVFRSLLEAHVDVQLEDNPFGCGCDIKWLVLNTTLLQRFDITPRCADGKSFTDLDPTYYKQNC